MRIEPTIFQGAALGYLKRLIKQGRVAVSPKGNKLYVRIVDS